MQGTPYGVESSSPAGVLWWVLAILTVEGSGEGQQEKTKETEIDKLKLKSEH